MRAGSGAGRLIRIVLSAGTLCLPSLAAGQAPPSPGGAPLDRSVFRYARRIPPGEPGLVSLRLDVAALAHSHLSDIRVVDRQGVQVPYVLEDDPEPLEVALPPLKPADGKEIASGVSQLGGRGRSVYAVTLPAAKMPPCRLRLDTRARVFERELNLLAKVTDTRRRDAGRWETVAWSTWRHTDPDRETPPLMLDLPTLDSTDARLVVDEGDNQPLPLEKPRLALHTRRLRFVRETGDALTLVYGAAGLGQPRYDLALLEARLRQEPAAPITADPEATAPSPTGPPRATAIFWVVFVAAIAVLGGLIVRLLSQANGK